MTNEEKQAAIEWLKGRPITMPGAKKMYALAIEALEMYVPDTNVGDMISRQDAIKAICEDGTWLERQGCTEITMAERKQRDVDIIEDLPPVHQKQTNCEYCHTDRDGYIFPLDKNSHAFIDRDKIVLKANGWRGKAKIKYCPICGRRLTDAVD